MDFLPRTRALAAVAAVAALAGAVALSVDLDRDGIRTWPELRQGTGPLDPDSDGDGLGDGAERRLGADPLRADTDGDALWDGTEWHRGGDPTRADTDGDGIPDSEEPQADCDNDGIRAIASSDDDSDSRPDGQEPEEDRCVPDVDGDGILDGQEGNETCVGLADCDGDGLPDAEERTVGYDMLRADTFGIGMPDAVAFAFEQRGQAPTPDEDGDGIPDGWEGSDGAIVWEGLVPQPGQRDLLIEYLRVVGPDSGRYASLDFTPAYQAVADMFATEGITVRWTETVVHHDAEQRPDFLSPGDLPYYRSVLENGTHSTNPYVTSVLLNPQQTQQHGSILGAAFLRSMIATIDYGAHTEIVFQDEDGERTTRIRPIVESQLLGGLSFQGFDDGGVLPDGRLFLHRPAQPATAFQPASPGYTVSWRPDWFRTAPYYETDDGQASLQLVHAGAVLHTDELASTIAHELGHTLGLCHLHEAACQLAYGGEFTRADLETSTMSYASQQTSLAFLDAEWDALAEYLRCPPHETTALVAQQAPQAEILAGKYERAFTQVAQQRECLELPVLQATMEPATATHYEPEVVANVGRSGVPALLLLFVGAIASATGSAWLAMRRWQT